MTFSEASKTGFLAPRPNYDIVSGRIKSCIKNDSLRLYC